MIPVPRNNAERRSVDSVEKESAGMLRKCNKTILYGGFYVEEEVKWNTTRIKDGVRVVDLTSWNHFYEFIREKCSQWDFVYRGQRDASWPLEPSLDRLERRSANGSRTQHLRNFKRATLGRRGPNPPKLVKENDWWALGQHYGLATPLLDWSTSPFVAAYFAFVEPGEVDETVPRRVVWALRKRAVEDKSDEITRIHDGGSRPPILEFNRPLSDENPRLVGQSGLFTRSPDNVDVESWVRQHFDGLRQEVLVKITIPDEDRDVALRDLNGMNINHMTLFPDLYGSGKFCNIAWQIPWYELD